MASRARGAVPRSTQEVVHRGVTWRRSSAGRVTWYNEGLGRWVTWSPGSDAPPVPAGWEKSAVASPRAATGAGVERPGPVPEPGAGTGTEGNAMAARPGMRSPYRLVPLVIFVAIIALAVYQATATSSASPQQKAQAYALSGRCLARNGGSASAPSYSAIPVSCSSSRAAVKVVDVVEPKGTVVRCPAGTEVAQILLAGVGGEPFECLARAGRASGRPSKPAP
ncbi:MAG TPA: hypothetical protein VFN61_09330 [Acidimicrobiales bacterium]|nr:hypothetical protein [Acidimicrobiales bacterium]